MADIIYIYIILTFIYIYLTKFKEICISLFMMGLLEFFNILINIKNMKEYFKDNSESNNSEYNNNQINIESDVKKINKKGENDENNTINQINKDEKSETNNSNIKYFSYGIFFSGLITFFISGGINSFLFIILINLIINNNFFNFKEKNIQIHYFFIVFCYLILSLRANFIDLVYLIIFCVEYWTILNKKYLYINLILNLFFFINLNYLNLLLFIFCMISFFIRQKNIIQEIKNDKKKLENVDKNEEKKENIINENIENDKKEEKKENIINENIENIDKKEEKKENIINENIENIDKKEEKKENIINKNIKNDKKEDKKNSNDDYKYLIEHEEGKIFVLNFFILSTLFFQTKGYECLEIFIIYVFVFFQMFVLLIERKIILQSLLIILPISFFLFLEYFFVANKFYNQKGVWINILYYYILFF